MSAAAVAPQLYSLTVDDLRDHVRRGSRLLGEMLDAGVRWRPLR